MKTIASFTSTEEAHVLRIKLENAGIEAFVCDDVIPSVMPYYTAAIGGIKIKVQDEKLEEALAVLQEENLMQVNLRDELTCPKCGSSDINEEIHKQRFYVLSFLLTFLTGAPMPIVRRRYCCNICKHLWK